MTAKKDSESRTPTLSDVAKAAGVSTMTVTRTLRGEHSVRPATAEKVMRAVEALGYRQNPMVQALMRSVRKKNVGFEANLAWVAKPRRSESVSAERRNERVKLGARQRAYDLGFGFEEVVLNPKGLSAKRMRSVLEARGVRGVLIAPLPPQETIGEFPWDAFPLATVGGSLHSPLISHAMLHYTHGMERVLRELTDRGYERVAFWQNPDNEIRSERMASMVFQYFTSKQPPENRVEMVDADHWPVAELKKWLDKMKPDALILAYPNRVQRIQSLDLPCMRHAGFATLSWREELPEIAGLRHPMEALGAAAVDIVVAQIHRNERGIPARAKTMLVEGDWVEGSSLRGRTSR